MKRRIIKINTEKCSGCGACAAACHEGAIGIKDGKAVLLREDYCDGLGDCLPACPENAISFEEREAAAYDEKAVSENKQKIASRAHVCPGSAAKAVHSAASQLRQWPVQIKLAPVKADHYDGASLLVAADCTAYAFGDIHNKFIKDRITLIGCPKLDNCDYSEKLSEIIKNNGIKDVTVVRMEVPCCGGIENAVNKAVSASGKDLKINTVIISVDGREI